MHMHDVGADVNGEKDERLSEKGDMHSEKDEIAVWTDEVLGVGCGLAEQKQGKASQREPTCEMQSAKGGMHSGKGKVLSVTGETSARDQAAQDGADPGRGEECRGVAHPDRGKDLRSADGQ